MLGDVHLRSGRFANSEETYRIALELEPGQTVALFGLGRAQTAQGKKEEAAKTFRRLLAQAARDPRALNHFAWSLVADADPRLHNGPAAVVLARKAVEAPSAPGAHWNTLGVALYRAGEYREAVTVLEKAMSLRNGGDAFDWFFLAMAHHHLGDAKQSRKYFEQAMQWMDKNQAANAELLRFRAEAESVLEKKASTPAPREKS
jgi:Flp pilus assembly protein TadD